MSRFLLGYLQSSVSSLLMARQSSIKRPLDDDPSPSEPLQDNPRVKRTKTGHHRRPRQQNHEVQTNSPSPSLSQDSHSVEGTADDLVPVKEIKLSHIAIANQSSPHHKTPRAAPTTLPSPALLYEKIHSANDHDYETITPVFSDTVTPLTRQALKEFGRMSSFRTKTSSGSSSRRSRHTNATTVSQESGISTKSDRVTPYGNSFEQILQDHGIYRARSHSMAMADLEELRQERGVRPSLAPSQCSDGEIEDVIEANANAATEPDIERDVVPSIVGRRNRLPHSGNVAWTNMSSMTESLTVASQPDLYYGTRVGDIPKPIRDSIGHLIIPSTVPNAPASPHFILENKGPAGSLEVVKRQAAHSAAAAARAAFALENFGVDDPVYDDKALAHAWTYTSSPGDLTQYAMRVSRPEPGSSQPAFHLTHIRTHHITESVEQFRKGVSAFRYCRDDSHARNQARLARANERVGRHSQQASYPDAASDPIEDEIRVIAGLPEARQDDVDDTYLTLRNHGSTPPLDLLEADGHTGEATYGYDDLLDQQLQADCEATFSLETSFSSVVATTSMTAASTYETAPPYHDASTNTRPRRRTRRPRDTSSRPAPRSRRSEDEQ